MMDKREKVRRKSDTHRQLAFVIVGGFIVFAFTQFTAMVAVPVFWPSMRLPTEFWVLLGNVTGFMAAKADTALGYYYGASSKEPSQSQKELIQ